MPLILAATPNCDWQSIVPLLESTALQPVHSTSAEVWYQTGLEMADDSKRYLLIHCRPELALAQAMVKGAEPEEALKQWLIAAQAMVSFFKHHRKQAVMVNLAHLQAQPGTMLKAICSHLGVGSDQAVDSDNLESLNPTKLPALELLLATQLVRQTENIDVLLAQVEACSVPLEGHGYVAPSVDVAQVLEGLKARELDKAQLLKQLTDAQQALRESQAENELLLGQLHQVQEELERQILRVREVEEQKTQLAHKLTATQINEQRLKQEKDQLQQTVTALNEQLTTLKSASEENSLLLEQLHLVQEELERQFIQKKQLQKQLDEYRQSQDHALEVANREISQLQDKLNSFRTSKAWKATAPVRAIGKPFRRTSPHIKSLKRQIVLVKNSDLFDQNWYLANYPDVAKEGFDPIEHYLKFGAKEGRNPGPEFDTNWYLTSYPDVATEGMNPLVHYIKFGRQEQRTPKRDYYPTLPAPTHKG